MRNEVSSVQLNLLVDSTAFVVRIDFNVNGQPCATAVHSLEMVNAYDPILEIIVNDEMHQVHEVAPLSQWHLGLNKPETELYAYDQLTEVLRQARAEGEPIKTLDVLKVARMSQECADGIVKGVAAIEQLNIEDYEYQEETGYHVYGCDNGKAIIVRPDGFYRITE